MGVHNTCKWGVEEKTMMLMIGEEFGRLFTVVFGRVRVNCGGGGGEGTGIQLYLPSVRCLGGADVCDAITAYRISRHR